MGRPYDYLKEEFDKDTIEYWNRVHEAASFLYIHEYISGETTEDIMKHLEDNIQKSNETLRR